MTDQAKLEYVVTFRNLPHSIFKLTQIAIDFDLLYKPLNNFRHPLWINLVSAYEIGSEDRNMLEKCLKKHDRF